MILVRLSESGFVDRKILLYLKMNSSIREICYSHGSDHEEYFHYHKQRDYFVKETSQKRLYVINWANMEIFVGGFDKQDGRRNSAAR